MLEYLYTGSVSDMTCDITDGDGVEDGDGEQLSQRLQNVQMMVELLQAADQFMLDHLKQICESLLQECVTAETVETLLDAADANNAWQLKAVCQHFMRNAE